MKSPNTKASHYKKIANFQGKIIDECKSHRISDGISNKMFVEIFLTEFPMEISTKKIFAKFSMEDFVGQSFGGKFRQKFKKIHQKIIKNK